MNKRIVLLCAGVALCLAPSAFAEDSALSQSKCPKGHVLPHAEWREDTMIWEICNGAGYEVLESAQADPLRKGIGTDNPQATLDVNGTLKIGDDGGDCNPERAGTLRWTGKAFEGCNGNAWISLHAGER